MIDLTKEKPLKIKEVAAKYSVHRRTVENWFKRGLEFVKIDRLVYTTQEAIQRYSQQNKAPTHKEYCQRESAATRAASRAARARHRI